MKVLIQALAPLFLFSVWSANAVASGEDTDANTTATPCRSAQQINHDIYKKATADPIELNTLTMAKASIEIVDQVTNCSTGARYITELDKGISKLATRNSNLIFPQPTIQTTTNEPLRINIHGLEVPERFNRAVAPSMSAP
ncbi:hypothetical protein D9M68_712000 [compost metagenome]